MVDEKQPAAPDHGVAANTDTHLWPIVSDDPSAPSIHVTAGGGLGINVGGYVIVKPIADWHAMACRESPFCRPEKK